MKRKRPTKTSIVPLAVLQAACIGAASVVPACGQTEANSADGNSTTSTSGGNVSIGMGGTVVVLAVSGFGGNVIALAVSGFGGVPNTYTASSSSTTSSATNSATSTSSGPVGAGGTLIVLAIAGFGGQLGEGGEGGALGEGGEAGASERELAQPGTDGQGSG